jgi:2-isopropylmalate synthase
MGFALEESKLEYYFEKFKELSDRKKDVSDMDIRALVEFDMTNVPVEYGFDTFVINSGNRMTATAVVKLVHHGETIEEAATGDGPVDAAFNAIERCTGVSFTLEDYIVRSVTGGKDAQGEVVVKIEKDGRNVRGRGLSTDIVEASVKAYVDAINRYYYEIKLEG